MKHGQNLPQEELIYSTTDNRILANKGINFTEHNCSVDFFIAAEQYIVIFLLFNFTYYFRKINNTEYTNIKSIM